MSQDPARRRFLLSAATGVAGLVLADLSSVMAASSLSQDATSQEHALPTLSEVPSRNPVSMTVVNYARYVQDRRRVDAARAEHQSYADALREHDRLVTGGPLLGDDGRASGVLLVYEVASKQEAEMLAQQDPFVQQGAIADYHLSDWKVLESNIALLAAALVPEDRRAPRKFPAETGAARVELDSPAARTYVNYAKYVSDRSRIDRMRPAHRAYARMIRERGALIMAGPLAGDSGEFLIYRAQSKDEAMTLVREDPYLVEGVFETYALTEWRMFGLNERLIPSR